MNRRTIPAVFALICSTLLFFSPPLSRAEDSMDDSATAPENDPSTNSNEAPAEAGPPSTITVPDAITDTDAAAGSAEIPVPPAQTPQSSAIGASTPSTVNRGDDDPVANYERAQNPPPYDAGLAEQFMMEDENDLPLLGVDVRLDERKLKSGENISGLLIVAVNPGSPAATAGLKGFQHKVTSAVETVAMTAAMVFPLAAPAAMLVPLLESSHIGERYDLIVAVDGYRVRNLLDLQDAVRDVQPGQTVYLSIVRDGKRLRVPVNLPRQPVLPSYPQ
jgi:hypothetical protein